MRAKAQDGLLCRALPGARKWPNCSTILHAFSLDDFLYDLIGPILGWIISASGRSQLSYQTSIQYLSALPIFKRLRYKSTSIFSTPSITRSLVSIISFSRVTELLHVLPISRPMVLGLVHVSFVLHRNIFLVQK